MKHELPALLVDRAVKMALEEDLASGDLTTEACIDADARAVAHAVARKAMVACGGPVFTRVFGGVDAALSVESRVDDGTAVEPGTRLWTVRGRARSVLMGERVALAFVQRVSGIATMARAFADAVPAGCRTRITDIRKTTPGLRAIERYAVRVGVTLARVAELARAGVDAISVGALTHSVQAADIGLDFE